MMQGRISLSREGAVTVLEFTVPTTALSSPTLPHRAPSIVKVPSVPVSHDSRSHAPLASMPSLGQPPKSNLYSVVEEGESEARVTPPFRMGSLSVRPLDRFVEVRVPVEEEVVPYVPSPTHGGPRSESGYVDVGPSTSLSAQVSRHSKPLVSQGSRSDHSIPEAARVVVEDELIVSTISSPLASHVPAPVPAPVVFAAVNGVTPLMRPPGLDARRSDGVALTTGTEAASTRLLPPIVTSGPTESVAGMRVLVVDDERSIRRLCQRMLEKLDCTCVALEDGDQVVNTLLMNGYVMRDGEQQDDVPFTPFHAVLMDIMMTRTNGVDAVIDLGTKFDTTPLSTPHSSRSNLQGGVCPTLLPPIIAMTANTSLADITSYKRAGFANVLGKPFEVATLKAKLLACRAGAFG